MIAVLSLLARSKFVTIDLVFVLLAVAVVLFALAAYRVMTGKPWKAWHEWVGLACFALAVLVELKF